MLSAVEVSNGPLEPRWYGGWGESILMSLDAKDLVAVAHALRDTQQNHVWIEEEQAYPIVFKIGNCWHVTATAREPQEPAKRDRGLHAQRAWIQISRNWFWFHYRRPIRKLAERFKSDPNARQAYLLWQAPVLAECPEDWSTLLDWFAPLIAWVVESAGKTAVVSGIGAGESEEDEDDYDDDLY